MTVCPTLCFSLPDWGEGSFLSPPQIVLNPNLASLRGLEIVGDDLEGLIDLPCRKRA
jgi:hypothetical protein